MSGCILHLSILHSPVFLLNSCLDLFSAPSLARRDPLSRSYRVSLPSSLTVNHSSALVYSTRLRVSVCGTGTCRIKFSGFSWKYDYTHYWIVLRTLHTIRFDSCSGFAWNNQHLHPSTDYSVSPRRCHDSVSTSLPQVVPEY